jgi:hypothetical protein
VKTLGDLAVFSVRQEASLQTCDSVRAGLVSIIDAANARANPKRRFWPF